jgi:hypothetical protein
MSSQNLSTLKQRNVNLVRGGEDHGEIVGVVKMGKGCDGDTGV